MSVPELKGVKMLVSLDGENWLERRVFGQNNMRNYPIMAFDNGNCDVTGWKHAKPLPQPWEVAPEGYRLVTEGEKEKYDRPTGYKYFDKYLRLVWESNTNGVGHPFHSKDEIVAYAVPLDYVFEEEVIEVTMAELEAKYGKKVKVVK